MNLKRLTVCAFLGLSSVGGLYGEEEVKPNKVIVEDESVDGIAKAVISRLKSLPLIITEVKDKDTAEVATKKIEVLSADLLELSKRLSKLEVPTEEQKQAISERFEAQLKDTNDEMVKALSNLGDDPELVKSVTLAMQGFGEKLAAAGDVFERYFEPKKKGE